MGARGSAHMTPQQRNAQETTRQIDARLAKDARKERSKVKMLLLGAGESGKSTVFKQFQILYGKGFDEAARSDLVPALHAMVVSGASTLAQHTEALELSDGFSPEEKHASDAVRALPRGTIITATVAGHIQTLWRSQVAQDTWARRSEFQISEANGFFFEALDRIAAMDYVPTVEDILYLRVRTTGIIEQEVPIDGAQFQIVDVGGQRNERKKWIHCFDDVTAVIFVAALSEFNQMLLEDETQNRMVEALNLFEEICSTSFFMHKPMILFLNKSDLFEEKLQHTNIRDTLDFADYAGADNDCEGGCAYFQDHFEERNYQPDRKVFTHVTCATDTERVAFVFGAARDIVLAQHMRDSDLL